MEPAQKSGVGESTRSKDTTNESLGGDIWKRENKQQHDVGSMGSSLSQECVANFAVEHELGELRSIYYQKMHTHVRLLEIVFDLYE